MAGIVNQPALVDLPHPARGLGAGLFVRVGSTLRIRDNTLIGSVTVAPDGTLHVHTTSVGDVSANADFDDITVENDGNVGISLLSKNNATGGIAFGDVDNNAIGQIEYNHNLNNMQFTTNGNIALNLSSIGAVTQVLQPAFLAHNSSTDTDVTGNGATAAIDFDTEIFDQNADFASDTFTAPVTGRYLLTTAVKVLDMSSASSIDMTLITSNRNYQQVTATPPDSVNAFTITAVADMDAADTASVQIIVSGMVGDTADIEGGATLSTFFSGCLLA